MAERTPLPDRQQIDGILSLTALEQLLQDVIEAKLAIEAQLEFSSRGEAWERGAIGALTAHRICETNIRRRINRVSGRAQSNTEAEATKVLAKAQNISNQALAEKNALQRRLNATEEQKVIALKGIRKAMERANYLVHFHRAAHVLLDEETCRRVQTEAQRLQSAVIAEDVESAAGVGALEVLENG